MDLDALAQRCAPDVAPARVRALLDQDEVSEVCVNELGCAHIETFTGWRTVQAPEVSFEPCMALATAVATFGEQPICEGAPLLSTALPTGERIQIVIPPVAWRGCISITIRKPSSRLYTLHELEALGMFPRLEPEEDEGPVGLRLLPGHKALLALRHLGRFREFFWQAVREKRSIVVAGDTASGKTTFVESLLQQVPRQERLVTIEDAAEISLADHPNKVQLYYSQGRQGVADVTPTELLRACLRMKPERIFLGELCGPEACDFLNIRAFGDPGATSSVYAGSCALTFERLWFLVGQSPAAGTLRYEQTKRLLLLVVDIIVHTGRVIGQRCFVREPYFDPARKLEEHAL